MRNINTLILAAAFVVIFATTMAGTTTMHYIGGWILILLSPEALNYLSQLTSLIDWWKGNFSKQPQDKVAKTTEWETENVTEETIKCIEDTRDYHREITFSITRTCRQHSI